MRAALAIAILACACENAPSPSVLPRELVPEPSPMGPADPLYAPQPHRERPRAIALAGDRLFVALQGTETRPSRQVVALDAATLEILGRIDACSSPTALAAHPGGRFVAVACRFASYAVVIDAQSLRVVLEVPVPFYTESIAFSPDGTRAVLGNRWKSSVLRWRVEAGEAIRIDPTDVLSVPDGEVGVPVPHGPRRVAWVGEHAIATSESELALALVDPSAGRVLATHRPNAPVFDAIAIGNFVYALHSGQGTGHPPATGFDGDHDGQPGDGTANVNFQDVQNEIDVLRASDLSLVHRYTSDSTCCRDYRDVDPDHPEAGVDLPPVDAWGPERAAFVPPRETWIVAGALPERAVAISRPDGRPALAVVFGGSSEVQSFDVDPVTGALRPREAAGALYPTGFGAIDAVWVERTRRLVVVDRLGETLTVLDLDAEPRSDPERVVVGDVAGGAFPATDAELGEALNTVTGPLSIDGDVTCVHCHRDGSPIGKPVAMPLLEQPEWGVRNVMAYRGAYDTRPWFLEAAMEQDNFFAVINELARKENFCCEMTDTRVWSRYPTREQCTATPSLEGCGHVLDCEGSPPPECAIRNYGGVELTRDAHFRASARRILGRDTSFGDALYSERVGPNGIERRPIPLGFDGITRAIGLFLLSDSRLLPSPYRAVPSARVRIGEALFSSRRTGCSTCHPLPVTSTALATAMGDDAPGPLTFGYVVSPLRHPETGADVDRITAGFMQTFPTARQTEGGLRVGVTQLRGAWDRVTLLHHGQARNLREALATPGHAALREGERGFNELDGQPDTHGATSGLSAEELEALIAYLETL